MSLRIGIGSAGTVGMAVARALDDGIDGMTLAAVSAARPALARERVGRLRAVPDVVPLEALAERCDVVVECAPAAVFARLAAPVLEAGRVLVPISVGALLEHWDLVALARRRGARIRVPSGALMGLDVLRAAAEGTIASVRMKTRKPPRGLAGAPYLAERGIDLEGLSAPLQVFRGSARAGAAGFPANVNVAAALALAGIGPDRTELEIWAEPGLDRNVHEVSVEADAVSFRFEIRNVPSEENPRTGRVVAASVVATLRGMTETLVVGT